MVIDLGDIPVGTPPTEDQKLQIRNAIGITAATVPNTPAGGIEATTVQAAINELDAEKAPAAAYARTDIDTTFTEKAIVTGGKLILGGVADGPTGRALLQSSTQVAAQTAIGIVTLTPAAYAALVLAGTTSPTTIYITTES
jgi:hypothetical protein